MVRIASNIAPPQEIVKSANNDAAAMINDICMTNHDIEIRHYK